MTIRTFTGKTGDVWTWEETAETAEALKQLHGHANKSNDVKFAGNYPGPLYAPHPHLKNETTTDAKSTNVG